jgi:hypothetical protein
MRAQRPPDAVPAVHGFAESLPFDDRSFDAAMAMVTVHQWSDTEKGVRELRRVALGPILILTFDGDALDRFWLAEYFPELIAAERKRYPPLESLREWLGGETEVLAPPVPIDCIDGFTEAYYARPEAFLDPVVRRSQSAWGFVEPEAIERGVRRLEDDLRSGAWERRYASWRTRDTFEGSLRLIVRRKGD